jgi:threonylcarbamoyladenosine tRNA methylthiotransferase MtaB
MKYAIVTFGCRVNQADSMAIERTLLARGAVPGPAEAADLVVVNSCAVTSTAEQGTRQAIRRVARSNPAARILVTGCYASRCPEEIAALPGVSSVVGNDRKDLADEWLTTAERYAGLDGPCGADRPLPFLLDRTALSIRVQTGCDERCSYCIIPSTRGRARSRTVTQVIDDVRRAEASGFREVTLTGVHLGAYGRDLEPAGTLANLLDAAVGCTDGLLLRLGSLEPMDVPRSLTALVRSGRLAPVFHLPLQHASDRVLARMRRPYTLDHYRRLVDRLRDELPDASIGADVIVGFPGETQAEFDELGRYVASSPLTQLHVFPYSVRPGTEAAAMPSHVPGAVIRERGRIVRELGDGLRQRFRQSQIGGRRPALTIEDGTVAVTDNGLRLRIGPGHARNERLLVEIAGDGFGRPVGSERSAAAGRR